MAGIRAKDTKPEVVGRKLLHRAGLRYSLHGSDLAGRPDVVFPKSRAVISCMAASGTGTGDATGAAHRRRTRNSGWPSLPATLSGTHSPDRAARSGLVDGQGVGMRRWGQTDRSHCHRHCRLGAQWKAVRSAADIFFDWGSISSLLMPIRRSRRDW